MAIAATLLFLALPGDLPERAAALGGEPATLDCGVTLVPGASRTLDIIAATADRDGNQYVAFNNNDISGTNQDDWIVRKYDTSCALRKEIQFNCAAGTLICTVNDLIVDHAGRVVVVYRFSEIAGSDEGWFIRVMDADLVTVKESASLKTFIDPVGFAAVAGLSSIRNSATELTYGFVTSGRLHVVDRNFTTDLSIAVTNAASLAFHGLADELVVRINSGTTDTFQFRNKTTGAFIEASPTFDHPDGFEPGPSQLSADQVFTPRDASPTMVYALYDRSIPSVTLTAFTPDQIDDGGLRTTTVASSGNSRGGYDLDAADEMLYCGQYDKGASDDDAFIASMKTSNDTMFWNVTFQLGNGVDTVAIHCEFDHITGFWVSGRYRDPANPAVNSLFVRHYLGGGFENPVFATEGSVTLPEGAGVGTGTGTTPLGLPDAGSSVKQFGEEVVGTSTGAQWLWGLILVISAFVGLFAVVMAIARDVGAVQGGMILGSIGAIGTMFFNGLSDIWPDWTLVVMILLTIVVIVGAVRRMFLGGA